MFLFNGCVESRFATIFFHITCSQYYDSYYGPYNWPYHKPCYHMDYIIWTICLSGLGATLFLEMWSRISCSPISRLSLSDFLFRIQNHTCILCHIYESYNMIHILWIIKNINWSQSCIFQSNFINISIVLFNLFASTVS